MDKLDKIIDDYTEIIVSNYRDIEAELIYKVATIWNEYTTVSGNLELFLIKLDQMDVLNMDIIDLISKISGVQVDNIIESIEKIGISTLDMPTFNNKDLDRLIDLKTQTSLVDAVINSQEKQLRDRMKLIESKARVGLYRSQYKAIQKASMEVQLGVKSPNQAIVEAVKDLASKGIHTDSYLRQGKEVHLGMEAVVRREVRSSFIQTSNDVTQAIGDELGTDDWYVTQHLGARTSGTGHQNHAEWQGKIYSSEEMVTDLGEGLVDGFAGINCRHRKYPFIKGVSIEPPPTLNMDELEHVYKLEQRQRRMERGIRTTKREINALKRIESEESMQEQQSLNKTLRRQQKNLREFINEYPEYLRRDYTRERVIE